MKLPYEEYPNIWKNASAWWTYLRGCLRKAWSTNPIKLELLKEKRKQIPNPNPKGKKATVWGFDCEMCHKTFPISECQVDHKLPAGKLQCKEDIPGFVERLLFVGKEDLRLVCKDCNNALALADKSGITYEEAIIEKKAIQLEKDKQDKAFILEHGKIPARNKAERRKQLIRILSEESE